jgi:hypothetical protein
MKKLFVIAVALIVSVIANAKTNSFVMSISPKTFVLDLKQWQNTSIEVSIKDETGVVIFNESLKNPKSGRMYILSQLENGNYTFVVEDAQKIVYQYVEVVENAVKINENTEEVFKPAFNTTSNYWTIHAMSLNKEANVKIIDNDGNVIFSETVTKPVVEKKYNVSKLQSGVYEIIYGIGDETFTHTAIKK